MIRGRDMLFDVCSYCLAKDLDPRLTFSIYLSRATVFLLHCVIHRSSSDPYHTMNLNHTMTLHLILVYYLTQVRGNMDRD